MGEGVFEERERLRNVEDAIPYRDCAVGVERFFAPLRMTDLLLASPVSGEVAHEV